MNISFELPQDIEHEITADGANLNADAKEAYLVDLYRQHKVSHYQISQALGLSRYETDGVLKKHGVGLGISPEEMRAQSESLREALREARSE
jgi:predicted HTH domain antitoxin